MAFNKTKLFEVQSFFINETKVGVYPELERWRQELKSQDFESRSKTVCMECNFKTNETTRDTLKLEEKEITPSG